MVNSLSRNNVDECDEIWSVTESRRGRWSVERGWQGPPAGVPRPESIQLTINRATSYVRIRRPTQAHGSGWRRRVREQGLCLTGGQKRYGVILPFCYPARFYSPSFTPDRFAATRWYNASARQGAELVLPSRLPGALGLWRVKGTASCTPTF